MWLQASGTQQDIIRQTCNTEPAGMENVKRNAGQEAEQ